VDEQAARDLLSSVQDAVLGHHRDVLDRLVADDFGLTGSAALGLLDKERWIDAAIDFAWRSFEIESVGVSGHSDRAVIESTLRQTGEWNGRAIDGRFFVVDVWRRHGDAWQLASRYAERLGD